LSESPTLSALARLFRVLSASSKPGPSGAVTYLHHDQQGSTRLLTNASGEVVGSTTYDGYGNILAKSGTGSTPLGYDGQYTDPDTGLIYLRARYYDPATAEFMTVDPREAKTLSVYQYARDNPISDGDTTGEEPEESRIAHEYLDIENEALKQLRRKHASSGTIDLFQEIIKLHFFWSEGLEATGGRNASTDDRDGNEQLSRIGKQLVGEWAQFATKEISTAGLVEALKHVYHITLAVRLAGE
jgi:RHS repeat-associated protein